MPSVNCIIYFLNLALLSSLCYLLLKLVVYVSKKPLWVEHMPSLNRVNPKVFTSHTLLVLHQIKFQHCNFIEREKWMKGYALEKWESTLNLCSCPWTRCGTYHGSFLQNIWSLGNSFGVIKLDPLRLWFRPYYSSLVPFPGQVEALVSCRTIP